MGLTQEITAAMVKVVLKTKEVAEKAIMENCLDKQKVKVLTDSIKEWWENHQYDVDVADGEEMNVYDEEPDFVKKAKELGL